jgi:hypothetical protein
MTKVALVVAVGMVVEAVAIEMAIITAAILMILGQPNLIKEKILVGI